MVLAHPSSFKSPHVGCTGGFSKGAMHTFVHFISCTRNSPEAPTDLDKIWLVLQGSAGEPLPCESCDVLLWEHPVDSCLRAPCGILVPVLPHPISGRVFPLDKSWTWSQPAWRHMTSYFILSVRLHEFLFAQLYLNALFYFFAKNSKCFYQLL